MSQAYDEYDAYGLGEKEQLIAIRPRVTPESSPEPVQMPVSPPASSSAKNAKPRRKALPSKGDAYLWRISQPNYTEVHRTVEHHLPSADSDDDDSMEDVADMDERLLQDMLAAEKKEHNNIEEPRQHIKEEKPVEEPPLSPTAAPPPAPAASEADMVDVADFVKQPTSREEPLHAVPEENEEDLPQIAAAAFNKFYIGSPPAQQPTPTDQMDSDRRQSNSTSTSAPSRKQSDGLGISIRPDAPSPFTPVTPIEPNFHNSEPFFAWSPPGHRGSIGSPGGKIPAISPASPEAATSPQTLPSLNDLIEYADKTNEVNRQRHASLSSMAAPSPLPNGGYRASFSNAHPSPSMTSEPRSSLVLSPPSGVLRRESYPLPSSATTASECHTSPDVATPHTLPTPQSEHRPSIDENTRTLPPIPGLGRPSISVSTIPAAGSGGYKCDFPGCTAPPFQTSYLLNSHANVHSTNRPHYCPVPGCPRGEGGKGFKRKNEMIRHGLVHDSPGYVCPFCPDREHKYPRPDNLQRHVRVHHTDKNREDPALRDVLAQRPELGGGNRGRRRRLQL